MALSVLPWMFACPRSAFIPPPGRPMFPSRSCRTAPDRISCDPVVWWVSPTAYTIVMTLSGRPISPTIWATLRKSSLGMPVIEDTISGV